MSYDPATTAILLVDPYNDFLSDGGKLWPRVKGVADDVGLLDHLREVISAARAWTENLLCAASSLEARRLRLL
jgi:nicotinamidase-related amidase